MANTQTSSTAGTMLAGKEEEGGLFYHKNSSMQQAIIANHAPVLFNFLDIPSWDITSPPGLFTICDYGCADGYNSTPVLREVITRIRHRYGTDFPIQVVYDDQAENDFRPIFRKPNVIDAEWDSPQSLLDMPNIFLLATGRSFYDQCMPSASVDLAICFTAVHWLSQVPCLLENDFFSHHSDNEEERKRYAQQAAQDWESFLLNRAKELKPGGRLFVNPVGGYTTSCLIHPRPDNNVFLIMRNVLRNMEKQGFLTREEMRRLCIRGYHRTEAEIKKPFTEPNSKILSAGIELAGHETVITHCPLYPKWKAGKDPMSDEAVAAHSKKIVGIVRAFSEVSFRKDLNSDRSPDDKDTLLGLLYSTLEDVVRKSPEGFRCGMLCHAVSIRKKSF